MWRSINYDEPPAGRVLVTTAEPEPLISNHNRLATTPVEIAFFQEGRWWVISEQPGAHSARLWFDPDLWMPIPYYAKIEALAGAT